MWFFTRFFLLLLFPGQISKKHIHQMGLKYTHFIVLVYRSDLQLPNLATFELKKVLQVQENSLYIFSKFVRETKKAEKNT